VTADTPTCSDKTVLDPENCNECIYPQTIPCQAPQVWDKVNGICDCTETKSCELANDHGMHFWNPKKCACDCTPSEADTNCPVNTVFDFASCACACNVTHLNCESDKTFNPIECKCTTENPYSGYI
jgi:hypothetical protein